MQPIVFEKHEQLEERHWWFIARRQIVARVLSAAVAGRTNPMILDVGCGTGGFTAALAGAGLRCIGVDTSTDAISRARQLHPGIDYRLFDCATDLYPLAREADVVLMLDVLEHIPDDEAFLNCIVAATRPGAHILITVPAKKILWSEHDVVAEHIRRYEIDELRKLLAIPTLDIRLLSYYNAHLYPIVRAVRWVRQHFKSATTSPRTDFSLPPDFVNRLLARIFASEASRLIAGIGDAERPSYSSGVSLIALAQKQASSTT